MNGEEYSMTEIKHCPVCRKKAIVLRLHDTYDKADFGWSCGCPSYRDDDGVHDKSMRMESFISAEDAVKKWNRMVEEYGRT